MLLVGSDANNYVFKDSYDSHGDDPNNPWALKIPKNRPTACNMRQIMAKVPPYYNHYSFNPNDCYLLDWGYSLEFLRIRNPGMAGSKRKHNP